MINMDKTKKKIKKKLKEFDSEIFDGLKGALGILGIDIERMKLPLEFSGLTFENHCKDYIEKYKDKIVDYANEILLVSNREKGDSEEFLELYMLLMGFPSFLVIEKAKEKGLID